MEVQLAPAQLERKGSGSMRGIMRSMERMGSEFGNLVVFTDPQEQMLKAELDRELGRCERARAPHGGRAR